MLTTLLPAFEANKDYSDVLSQFKINGIEDDLIDGSVQHQLTIKTSSQDPLFDNHTLSFLIENVDNEGAIVKRKEDVNWSIFPNPTKGPAIVRIKDIAGVENARINYSLIVTTADGKNIVFENTVDEMFARPLDNQIDLSGLPSGTYVVSLYIKLENGRMEVVSKKVVKTGS